MKLPFEEWLEKSRVPREAKVAFDESLLSYKVGAYRAGLLFAYVGTALWLRRRLMNASRPEGVPEKAWESTQKDLLNDNKWEPTVFRCIESSAPKDYFGVDKQLRDEFKYWRDRRNDCAHFKTNTIAAAHVESFWLFVQSSIGRWVPNGSVQDLIERFVHHFDTNLTPPGSDVGPLAERIQQAAPKAELADFFDRLKERFTRQGVRRSFVDNSALADIHGAVLRQRDEQVTEASVNWLLRQSDILLEVLRNHPSHVTILAGRPKRIRHLWKTEIFLYYRGRLVRNDHGIFIALLRNGLIPEDEIDDALMKAVSALNGNEFSPEENLLLEKSGFWDQFRKYAIEENKIDQFEWGNRNAEIIALWVKSTTIDLKTAQVICDVFSREPYPDTVRDALKDMLAENPKKLAELQAIAAKAGVTVPAVLT